MGESVCSTGWKLNLMLNIKRELALLRQMLPDARTTGCFYPDGSRLEPGSPTVAKSKKVVSQELASQGRFLEGQAHARVS